MACWSCGLPLPPGARFCARCGVRQRVEGLGAPPLVIVAFTLGACAAGLVVLVYGLVLLSPEALSHDPQLAQVEQVGSLVAVIYGAALVVLQAAAVTGLARARAWGRVVGTIACLLWALTVVGLAISLPVLYYMWRPPRGRR
jgi:hypothetical protein